MIKLSLDIILKFFFFITIVVICSCQKNPIEPNGEPIEYQYSLELITPDRIKNGDELPMVIRADEASSGITQLIKLSSNNAYLEEEMLSIRKGTGSLTTVITANEAFTISTNNYNFAKEIELVESYPEIEYSGSIQNNIEKWDTSFDRIITSDLTIPYGAELIIEAGTNIKLLENVNIHIYGDLTINGTKESPVLFTSKESDYYWGGVILNDSSAKINYCFFIKGGGDSSYNFGHSNSQPVIKMNNSEVEILNSFIIDNIGKAFGSSDSVIRIEDCLISRCDTGGEFHRSITKIYSSHVLELPAAGNYIDDNDGFYFYHQYSGSAEPSEVKNCFIIDGKDDGIDQNSANLNIENCWIEDFMHEGIATSYDKTINVFNTVVKECGQGIESGKGHPYVNIDHCVIVNNAVGLRFGDNYAAPCTGKITATNSILFNNNDSILNYVIYNNGSQHGAIDISYSITNDEEYDGTQSCINAEPIFDTDYVLHPNSPGIGISEDGSNAGLVNIISGSTN